MTRRGIALLLCVLGASSAACGGGGGFGAVTREVTGAIDEVRAVGRTFRYTDETLGGDQRIVVDGKVQDDLRYSGTITLNGTKLYEAVVSDDSVALRLLDLDATAGVINAAERSDPVTAKALREGRWVVDHTTAPPLLAAAAAAEEERTADNPNAGQRRQNLVGDDPFIDGAQVLNYSERAVRAVRVELFNPDDIQYNALDDPWRADAKVELEDEGIRRYDLFAPPLPRPAERGSQQALPQIEHFRKMAIYVKGQRVTEIKEQISLTDRREFRRAESGRSAAFYLRLRDSAKAGELRDELRERAMSYRVVDTGDVEVSVPLDAEEGLLGEALPELKKIFNFAFIGGDAVAPIVGPGGSPLPVPGGQTSPAPTTPAASP
jgi:hypothetical protein